MMFLRLLLFSFVWQFNYSLKSITGTVFDLPDLGEKDTIEFYYLESSLPFNAPINIIKGAGIAFNQYATTHAGIGVWDMTTGVKLTIEFVAHNYVGSLLPICSENLNMGSKSLFWNNTASVIIRYPMDPYDWVNSRHISSATGVSYQELKKYLQNNNDLFQWYQPITVLSSTIEDLVNDTFSVDDDSISIDAQNSYWFVSHIIQNLANFGCNIESFIPLYASDFIYFNPIITTESNHHHHHDRDTRGTSISSSSSSTTTISIPPTVVSWSSYDDANIDVYDWFRELTNCYTTKAIYTQMAGTGAEQFLESIQTCYLSHSYAYIYASPSSVYNITLLSLPMISAISSSDNVGSNSDSTSTDNTGSYSDSTGRNRDNASSNNDSTSSDSDNASSSNDSTTTISIRTSSNTDSSSSSSSATSSHSSSSATSSHSSSGSDTDIPAIIMSSSSTSAPQDTLPIDTTTTTTTTNSDSNTINNLKNSPRLIRYIYTLPPKPKYVALGLTSLDYLLIVIAFAAVIATIFFFLQHYFLETKVLPINERMSFESSSGDDADSLTGGARGGIGGGNRLMPYNHAAFRNRSQRDGSSNNNSNSYYEHHSLPPPLSHHHHHHHHQGGVYDDHDDDDNYDDNIIISPSSQYRNNSHTGFNFLQLIPLPSFLTTSSSNNHSHINNRHHNRATSHTSLTPLDSWKHHFGDSSISEDKASSTDGLIHNE